MPVFLRISATDWLENVEGIEGWDVDQTVKLSKILAQHGVDLIDISSGGLHPAQKIKAGPGFQSPFAKGEFFAPISCDYISPPLSCQRGCR